METIHLKTTIALIYVTGFIFFSFIAFWLIELYDLKINRWFCLAAGFSGILVTKELFNDVLCIGDESATVVRYIAYILGFIIGLIFIVFWLVTYVILSPVYFIYFIGFILGKGINAANNERN